MIYVIAVLFGLVFYSWLIKRLPVTRRIVALVIFLLGLWCVFN